MWSVCTTENGDPNPKAGGNAPRQRHKAWADKPTLLGHTTLDHITLDHTGDRMRLGT